MKTIFKHFLATAVLLLVSVSMNAELYSGDCGADGDNVKWTLDTETGLLSITGVGMMSNYGNESFPWYSYREAIIKVNIENGVASIGSYAFFSCSRLNSIIIPDGVNSIGESAFRSCTGLTSINIPESVTSIRDYAFSGCSGLTSINIPEGVTSIEREVFRGCSGLTSITIPESVTLIGLYAFAGCSNLTSINIPEGVTSIYEHAFQSCSRLTSIIIPKSVTKIWDYAFERCSGLTSIHISEGVTSIGQFAFQNCSGLTSVTIPSSVTIFGSDAFSGCSGLTSVIISEGVTFITSGAFTDCTGLTSITIPESVTKIGNYAFNGCTGLASINIPESVTSIGSGAFSGCSGLTSINIPEGVTCIGRRAFYDCSGLTSINIPEGVTRIENEAFYGCSGLISINIPKGVTDIGDNAFYGCTGIKEPTYNSKFFVRLPVSYKGEYSISETIVTICSSAFSGCSGLTSINIPDGVKSIGDYAFSGCSGLTSTTIPESTTSIGNETFQNCSSLTSITIPEGVTTIGERAFKNCSSLTSIIVNGNISSFGMYAFNGVQLKYVEINGNMTDIPNWNNSRLAEVKIGDKVTTLYNQTFSGCSALKKVTLGKSLQYIRNDNFKNCAKLDSVFCYSEEPPYCYPGVFDGTDLSKSTLVVSKRSIDKYKETAPWSEFGIISARQSFTITYMVNGEVYKTEDYEQGETIDRNEMPEREGYTFSGWSNLPESMPAENITVTGTFTINQYWVTYEVDGKTYTSEKLEYGSAIMPPTMQEKEGCDFVWEEYPEAVPASDITIKGRYVPRTYILTYLLDGKEYKTIEVTYGSEIQPEEIEEREGYTFSGWEGLPNTMPAGNVTVTGAFTVNRYTLTYILNGEVYKTEEMEYGSSITPEMPEMEGYIFSGWEGLPDTMPAGDVTVRATFVANSFTLTYLIDGEEYKTYTLTYGSDITPENAPEREGYSFSGWDGLPGTMPAGNVTVTGHYTVNEYWVTFMVDGKPYTSEKVAYGSVIVPPEMPDKEGFEFEWAYIPDTMPAKDIMVYGSYTTGIAEIMADQNVAGIYSIDGKRLSRPQRGLNIIRMKDGTVKRVMVK